jgi:hypothetical protein
MPLRILQYFANVLYTIALDKDFIYSTKLIKLPAPKFYVVYNGKIAPKEKSLKLSDAYLDKSRGYDLEVEARIIDIEYERFINNDQETASYNEKNSNVYGYSYLIHEIHRNLDNGVGRDQAIKSAVEKCVREGVLTEYIKETGLEEVLKMFNYGYDRQDELDCVVREAREAGIEKGMEKGMAIGETKALTEVIQNLKARGMSIEEIAEITSLTVNEAVQYYENAPEICGVRAEV